jgi:hypothetical protein
MGALVLASLPPRTCAPWDRQSPSRFHRFLTPAQKLAAFTDDTERVAGLLLLWKGLGTSLACPQQDAASRAVCA